MRFSPAAGGHAPSCGSILLMRISAKSSTTKRTRLRHSAGPALIRPLIERRASVAATPGSASIASSTEASTAPVQIVAEAGFVARYPRSSSRVRMA
jgi:hypothetical protein